MFLEIEAGLTVFTLFLAFMVPSMGSQWFEVIERFFGTLAKRRGLSVLVAGATALVLRAVLLPILPIPQPGVHDEFAYLLLSDTFAHGRLTNPTNPMWVHFESFHIIWKPTYTAMFWPAQGLIMAVGQVLTGQPFWGVWLSDGLMCAAITWMLQGWLEPEWALLGGFLAVIRLGTFSYWANSYFGGAVAAIGGALVLGALPRVKKTLHFRDVLLMGLGFALLANSRPYEGVFLGIPVALAMLIWLWRKRQRGLGLPLRRVIGPLLGILALTLVGMGYYFWRTTGSPFNTPYMVDIKTYNPVPYFPWQPLKRFPAYHFKVFQEYYLQRMALPRYEAARSIDGTVLLKWAYVLDFWGFFLGPALTLPFVLAWVTLPFGYSWRDISLATRFLLMVLGAMLVAEALPIYYLPHYSAPVTGLILALVLATMRRVRRWKWHGRPSGLFITRSIPAVCLLLFALRIGAGITGWPPVPKWPGGPIPTWCSLSPQNPDRAATLAKLREYPGRQLVIVHYGPRHDIYFNEWVYNRADLSSAKVIWARDMGPKKNEELIRYFKNRHVWLVDADDHPPKLLPYSEVSKQATAATVSKAP